MKKMMLGVAVVLTAVVAQPALARDHHGDRDHEYRERHFEGNRGHYRERDYDYYRHGDRRYDNGHYGYYEPPRDRHYEQNYYNYDRHSRRPERRHHRRNHH